MFFVNPMNYPPPPQGARFTDNPKKKASRIHMFRTEWDVGHGLPDRTQEFTG